MNKRGIAEVALLIYVIIAMGLLFVPNPVSKAVGVGVQPNKIMHTEKVELIKDKNGQVVGTRTITDDTDQQPKQTFWDWLMSLPHLVVLLMLLGIFCPPIAVFLHNARVSIMNDTKKIVVGIDNALKKVTDPAVKQTILDELDKSQDTSTKNLVNKIQGKT